MNPVITRAAQLYADAHAPWPWQRRLHAKLAAAYMCGVNNAWGLVQLDMQAVSNPKHVPHDVAPPVPTTEA